MQAKACNSKLRAVHADKAGRFSCAQHFKRSQSQNYRRRKYQCAAGNVSHRDSDHRIQWLRIIWRSQLASDMPRYPTTVANQVSKQQSSPAGPEMARRGTPQNHQRRAPKQQRHSIAPPMCVSNNSSAEACPRWPNVAASRQLSTAEKSPLPRQRKDNEAADRPALRSSGARASNSTK